MLPIEADFQDIEKKETIIEQKVQTTSIKKHLVFSKSGLLAGIIKIPSNDEQTMPYQELPRTFEDERKIDDLITSLGIHGKLTLLLHHEKRLRKMGDEIRYVHPFKFLGYIFSHPDLKEHMAIVIDDYFKRTHFVKDFSQAMEIHDLKNKLMTYIDDFAQEVNVPANEITPFINNKDWEGLLRFLISYKN